MEHVEDKLQALLAGRLEGRDVEEVETHLAACPRCREERDLMSPALGLMAPLPPVDPRPGFAARVALAAQDRRPAPLAQWLRWSAGGFVVATAAAVVVAVLPAPQPRLGDDVMLAQRLELFEDLAVLQNQQALEDMEVVSVLHTLEARQ
ncbi:MAG TPA: zf-HC2 domain-containing protein [Myxococcales bacterium]|nr:zf-HC2 domain-containing protein [Myxococcales bacterium]